MVKSIDIKSIRGSVSEWLNQLQVGLLIYRFRFCLDGDLVPRSGHQAQMSTCFAMKIAWQTGIWESWPAEKKNACISFVKSFQNSNGYFIDPWLKKSAGPTCKDILRIALGKKTLKQIKEIKIQNVRAETRQSASTLFMVGEKPNYPLPFEVKAVEDVVPYFKSFDWTNPWGAGSHISHQLFLLTVNKKYFNMSTDYEEIVDAFLEQINSICDPETGSWFTGHPSDVLKLNGAMKIFSGLQWLDRPYPDTKSLLDFALAQPFQKDGCSFLNRLFVIWQAQKGVPEGYRIKDVRSTACEVLEYAKNFIQSDGAFSFFHERSQVSYYSAKVSRGKKVSDLHGTTMLTWAIAIACELLSSDNSNEKVNGWKPHNA